MSPTMHKSYCLQLNCLNRATLGNKVECCGKCKAQINALVVYFMVT
jgi:hypothetical protein